MTQITNLYRGLYAGLGRVVGSKPGAQKLGFQSAYVKGILHAETGSDTRYGAGSIQDDGEVTLDLGESRNFVTDVAEKATENVPFTVRIAQTDDDFRKAVCIRHAAYARHVPAVAEKLREPEAFDRDPGIVVLLAESKLDGSPLGTMRIHTSRYNTLPLEGSVDLPDWLKSSPRSEANRLGVSEGRIGRLVKHLLFKAYFRYCLLTGIEWIVIAARSPLDRQYDALMFTDLFRGEYIPMRHGGNIPHRVLALGVTSAEQRWAAASHPLFDFMIRTRHPDIEVGEDTVTPWGVAPPGNLYAIGSRA
ncbi:MAG: hypothetical protein MUC55_02515 [Burkholderiales bacterium]|nr:hypothetical protein [Burkholderiales bacterium]